SYSSSRLFNVSAPPHHLPSSPTRRSSDLQFFLRLFRAVNIVIEDAHVPAEAAAARQGEADAAHADDAEGAVRQVLAEPAQRLPRSEEHTSELQSLTNLVCRLLLEKKKKHK